MGAGMQPKIYGRAAGITWFHIRSLASKGGVTRLIPARETGSLMNKLLRNPQKITSCLLSAESTIDGQPLGPASLEQ